MRLEYLLLCQLQDALQRLPLQQREAYEDALINAPSVVQAESNPLQFLRAEGGNTSAAALRLCRYWQERKRAFGQRAFLLPILRPAVAAAATSSDQSLLLFRPGDAFEAQDVEAIQQQQASGAVMLPPDSTGCSVLLFDPCRISDSLMERSDLRLRALFYTLHCMAQNPQSQEQGVVLIVRLLMNTGKSHPAIDTVHDILSALICHVLPIRGVKGLHLVACLDSAAAASSSSSGGGGGIVMMDNPATSTWIQRVLPMRQAQWETSFRHKPVLHIAAYSANLAGMLQPHGLLAAGLPETLGGSWQYEHDDSAKKKQATSSSSRKRPASSSFASSQQQTKQQTRMTSSSEEGAAAAAFRRQQQQNMVGVPPLYAAAIPPPPPTSAPLSTTSSRNESEDVLFHDTPTMRQLGLARLREAMLSLPNEKRAAYFEAMIICPDLVQTESDPIRFLRFEKYNAWAAARRLARYWEKRKEIFGLQRAFLPLTTGTLDGALNAEDIASVETGYIFFLPQDMQGRTVLCYDASRRVFHSAESRKRVAFYWMSIICENEMSQRDGYVLLMPIGMASFSSSPFDKALKENVDIAVECFPTKTKNVHLVHYLPESGAGRRRSLLERMMPMLLAALGRLLDDKEKTFLHPTESREDILTSFARFGLLEQGLPVAAAGTWNHDNFYTWLPKRRAEERERYGLMVGQRQYPQNESSLLVIPQVNTVHHHPQANTASVAYHPSLLERLLGSNHHPQVEHGHASLMAAAPASFLATAAATLTGRAIAASQQASVPPAAAVASSLPSLPPPPAATLSGNVNATATPLQQAQQQQDMAQIDYLIRRLPEREKAAYCEALRRAPHLVEKESNPAAFFGAARRRRDDNTWQLTAARKIAMYWTIRKELFGSTNAFLPMTQTGEGALGRTDLIALTSGYFVLVPTKKNRQVLLCYDASKVDSKTDRQCRLRVAFYLLSIASERRCSDTPQEQPGGGAVGGGGGEGGTNGTANNSFVIITHGLAAHQQQHEKEDLERILDVMPGQVDAIHILTLESGEAPLPGKNDDNFDVESAVLEMRRKFGKYGNEKGIVHRGATKDEVCAQLQPYGLFREWLPKALGGTFGYDRFVQWQELRTRYEWGLPAGAKDEEACDVYDFSSVLPLSALSEADRKERKRRMNVVHSRRKRERERIEIEVLQEQCLELRDAQQGLRAQNEHLQNLVSRVDACLAVAGGATRGSAALKSYDI